MVVVAPPVQPFMYMYMSWSWLVVQVTLLLLDVVARVVLTVVWVGARVAPLHEHELPFSGRCHAHVRCIMRAKSTAGLLFCVATD